MTELEQYANELADQAREASLVLMKESGEKRAAAIRSAAAKIEERVDAVLEANAKDLDAAADLPAATVGRLKLDAAKVAKIAKALREIADQPDPLGRV
ncbi:MAG: gamma-glutamyl-phosphate reductase, partial [Planctomycetota bacterium]